MSAGSAWDDNDAENGWNDGGGWGDDTAEASTGTKKTDDRKQKAEQRRMELEKKRQAKQAGPMKLGAKKVGDPFPFD